MRINLAAALPLLLWLGCAAQVVQAPFPEQPDTVRPGSLRGPFSGQVVEQGSGTALSGALVIGTWSYERRGAVPLPATTRTASLVTRSDGTYELQAVPAPGPGTVLTRFTMIVYKAGYLGYRSDVRWDDRGPRRDFAQRRHRIVLERFPEGESHARHLAFLGGPAELRRAAQAEVIQAALELSEAQPPRRPPADPEPVPELPPLPDVRALLPQEEVAALARGVRYMSEPLFDNLAGERPGPRYAGVRHRALGRPDAFDAGLRLWRPAGTEAVEALWQRAQEALGGREIEGPGDRAFASYDAKRRIHGAVALLREAGLVLEVACGASLCPKEGDAARLLARAIERLDALPRGEPQQGEPKKGGTP